MADQMSYGEAKRELDAILARLSRTDVDIDNLSTDVARATELIALCRDRLAGIESEVGRILKPEE
ncbi:MAG: exodeoxyribonuclease VII small subunit [Tidjanibacter sp.]|nr:exodeoxyribonuclease VII small subunit [Tidjanibacter sp.]MBR6813636.1 exodeoxyribonuclease VII small subunit [Tidjanibacter sp.]